MSVEGQDSFLECLAELLNISNLTQEDLDATRNDSQLLAATRNDSQLLAATRNDTQHLLAATRNDSQHLLANPCPVNNSGVLLQNATMPRPPPNNTLPTPLAGGMGLPLPIHNNTNTSCLQQLNDTGKCVFDCDNNTCFS